LTIGGHLPGIGVPNPFTQNFQQGKASILKRYNRNNLVQNNILIQSALNPTEDEFMHRHNVFFWLKEGLSDSALLEFEQGLESLTHTPLVLNGYFGKPANTNRAVVDNSYSYGLTLIFKDTTDHNLYQVDPTHRTFVDQNSLKWTRVQVYDFQTK
jgi:hypothetical protein